MKRINSIKALKEIIGSKGKTLYVRWSRGFAMDSKQGESRDYLNGGTHSGLSAVEINPEWAEDDKWMARRITEYRFLKMKDSLIGCHIYSGREIGKDSDGYESIDGIEHIATLSTALIEKLLEIKNL